MRGRGNRTVRRLFKRFRNAPYNLRRNQGFITLDVYNDRVVREAHERCGFREPVGSRGVRLFGENGFNAVFRAGLYDVVVIRCHRNARGTGKRRALRNAHDHGFAGNVHEGFVRKAR